MLDSDRKVDLGQIATEYMGATLPTDFRLAVTLRILAGAQVLEVGLTYKVACGTVYDILHDKVEAFDKVLKFPRLPRATEGLNKIARGFKLSRYQSSPLDGFVGVLDGICIKMKELPKERFPLHSIVGKDNMQFRFRQCVNLTTFSDMPLAGVVVRVMIHLRMRSLVYEGSGRWVARCVLLGRWGRSVSSLRVAYHSVSVVYTN